MRLPVVLGLILLGLGFWAFSGAAAPPALIAGFADEGFAGAPCPSRSLYEQSERRKHGARPPTAFGQKLQALYPLGQPAATLRDDLLRQGFEIVAPCANDESAEGARWRASKWGEPDAYVYWRADAQEKLIFVDGHVGRAE